MSSEQDTTPDQELTDKKDVDPSIDPTKLIVQEGDDAGRIAAVETSEGTRPNWKYPKNEAIEGLPVIGAQATDVARDDMYKDNDENPPAVFSRPKNIEYEADLEGTEAMAEEVKNRAVKLATEQFPLASPEIIEQFGQKAADKFEDELESKNAKKKAGQEHSKGVQGLIDSLGSPDTQLSDVVPMTAESKIETPGQESQTT